MADKLAPTTPVWALGELGQRRCLVPPGFRSGIVCYVELRQAQQAGMRFQQAVSEHTLEAILVEAQTADLALYVVGGSRVLYLDADRRVALDLAELAYRA